MKKYLFGILALVVAIGFSAFTAAPKKPTSTFQLVFTGDYTGNDNQVADLSKWQDDGFFNPAGCSSLSTDQKACILVVDEMYTHDDDGVQVLNESGNTPVGEFRITAITPEIGTTITGVDYYRVQSLTANGGAGTKTFDNGILP
jgi:hypothetical protein